jgi:hypothetical protein
MAVNYTPINYINTPLKGSELTAQAPSQNKWSKKLDQVTQAKQTIIPDPVMPKRQTLTEMMPMHKPSIVIHWPVFLEGSMLSIDNLDIEKLVKMIEGGRDIEFKATFGLCKSIKEVEYLKEICTTLDYRNGFVCNETPSNISVINCAIQSTITGIMYRKRSD